MRLEGVFDRRMDVARTTLWGGLIVVPVSAEKNRHCQQLDAHLRLPFRHPHCKNGADGGNVGTLSAGFSTHSSTVGPINARTTRT
jgi:hypothetical protein